MAAMLGGQPLGRDLQALALAEQHGQQLPPACDERGQPLLIRLYRAGLV